MKFKISLITFFSLIIMPFAYSQNSARLNLMQSEAQALKRNLNLKSAPETKKYDVDYYRLDLSFLPSNRTLSGNVTTYFTAKDTLSEIVFDLNHHLTVDSVKYKGDSLSFLHSSSNVLKITLPANIIKGTRDSVIVHYHGFPVSSQGGFNSFESIRYPLGPPSPGFDTALWTFSVPYGASDWWPCKNTIDDKADSVEMIAHVPYRTAIASNGLLIRVDTSTAETIYHWKTRYPIATYLIAFAIADYDIHEEYLSLRDDSLLMQHFLYKTHRFSQASEGLEEFMQLYDSLFGPYPFMKEKYGHASFIAGGGMEHQTMSFMTNYDSELKAHELAHQWFGNKVTCGTWKDVWLNEGFATYLEALTFEFNAFHQKTFLLNKLNIIESAALNFRSGSVHRLDTSDVANLFNRQVYDKAAMTLHTLRWKIGDNAFFQGVRNYLDDTKLAYSFATSEDLKRHLEITSGQDLTEFFDDWVFGKGFPIYHTFWSQEPGQFSIRVEQDPTHSSVEFFEIPVPYQLLGPDLDTIIVVDPSFSGETFNIDLNKQVTLVNFDPENKILARKGVLTGLEDLSILRERIQVFPNPADNFVFISKPNNIQIENVSIRNIKGQTVVSSNDSKSIDISPLSNGIYFLELIVSGEIIVKKFVKK